MSSLALSDDDWLRSVGVRLRLLGWTEQEVNREIAAMRSQGWASNPALREYAEGRIRDDVASPLQQPQAANQGWLAYERY